MWESTGDEHEMYTNIPPSHTSQLYFADEPKKGRTFESLYELVQHAGNVLPRLYLMCTVGTCFIRSKEGFAKDVLRDLAEMCKGVQHPTRGLFLRSYLCQVCLVVLGCVYVMVGRQQWVGVCGLQGFCHPTHPSPHTQQHPCTMQHHMYRYLVGCSLT